jgi:GNAT superfamily N-acetyltransferase
LLFFKHVNTGPARAKFAEMKSHPIETTHGTYIISDDPARLQFDSIYDYLVQSYWSEDIPRETLERALKNSLCVGAYTADGIQVGLTRIVSDFATYCYVCDVYVLEEHRGQGLSKAMMALVSNHPKLQGLRRWTLATRDAHGLYAQFGFTPLKAPDRFMEKHNPNVYQQKPETA